MPSATESRPDRTEREGNGASETEGAATAKAAVSLALDEARAALEKNPQLGSFFSSLKGYFTACKSVKSLDGWMQLNKQRFGSEILYADEVSGGLIVGYASGLVAKKALKLGILLVGAGYVAVQVRGSRGPLHLPAHV